MSNVLTCECGASGSAIAGISNGSSVVGWKCMRCSRTWDRHVTRRARWATPIAAGDLSNALADICKELGCECDNEAALAAVARLKAALRPFVQHYSPWMDEWPDGELMSIAARVTFGQLRAALAALTPKGTPTDAL